MARELNSPPPVPPRPLDALAKLPDVCEILTAWLDYVNEVADSTVQTLNAVVREKPELLPLLQQIKGKGRRLTVKAQQLVTYARLADLKWGPVYAYLFIDGQTVRLPPKLGLLADLLLAEGSPLSAQARVGWKSRKSLRLELAKRTGRKVSKHALENLICRLKEALRTQAGLDWLLQKGGPLGVRFALQKYVSEADRPSCNGGKPESEQGKKETDYGAYLGEI
jgi:hypothetical protein